MTIDSLDNIDISVISNFLEDQSNPEQNHFVFSYTIKIINNNNFPVQLISRYWVIIDSNNKHEEIVGEGVVGEQPVIKPNEFFEYTSGAILETEMGTMEGFYNFIENDDLIKKSRIPKFILSIPRVLH